MQVKSIQDAGLRITRPVPSRRLSQLLAVDDSGYDRANNAGIAVILQTFEKPRFIKYSFA